MTIKRQKQIQVEAKRRLNEWLKNSTFAEMCSYSYIRFCMQLGLSGYPFEKPEWMKGKKFNKFVTEKEYDSREMDSILNDLFIHLAFT
jgi:hypothetical protein